MCSPSLEDKATILEHSSPKDRGILPLISFQTINATTAVLWGIFEDNVISRKPLSPEEGKEANPTQDTQLDAADTDNNMGRKGPPLFRVMIAEFMMFTLMNSTPTIQIIQLHHPQIQGTIGGRETTWGNGCRQAHFPEAHVLPSSLGSSGLFQ